MCGGLTLLFFAIPTEKDGILCHGMSRFDTVLGEYKINGESQIAAKASVCSIESPEVMLNSFLSASSSRLDPC
jgi:hypothetical protein